MILRPTRKVFTHMETSPLLVKGFKFRPGIEPRYPACEVNALPLSHRVMCYVTLKLTGKTLGTQLCVCCRGLKAFLVHVPAIIKAEQSL